MVSSFVSAVTLMLAFIFGPPVGYARLHKRDGLSLGEGRFYCTYCSYRYIRTKLHPVRLSLHMALDGKFLFSRLGCQFLMIEVILPRELHPPPLPATHVSVGYLRQNVR